MKIHTKQYDEERVMKLWRDGVSVTIIAKRMGISTATVSAIIKRREESRDAEHSRD